MRGLVKERMVEAIERNADKVVSEMRAMLAIGYPEVAAVTEIDWTWGDAPRGSIAIGKFGANEYEMLVVTIYARGKQGSGISTAWFEFGTHPRVQKTTGRETGQITAFPFFFTVFRANRQRVQNSLRATLRRAVKRVNNM